MAGTALVAADTIDAWLRTLPAEDGVFLVSEPRRYNSDENAYDTVFKNDPSDGAPGAGLVALARESGADLSGAALEVGCGTGKASVGLVGADACPLTLITDSSRAFVEIARRKCGDSARTRYGVLRGEEVSRLPAGAFSLIAMRAVLHHVTSVETFIADTARLLLPGGVLICQEPCWDGLVLKGLLAQFVPLLAEAAGAPLPEAESRKIRGFVESMRVCARRDVDKSKYEDKHGFRPDEMMRVGARHGLAVEFHANVTLQTFTRPAALRRPHRFVKAFVDQFSLAAGLAPETLRVVEERLLPYCGFLEDAARGGAGPYFYGVFVFKKA
jgi:SAM-dependent methyltransferase